MSIRAESTTDLLANLFADIPPKELSWLVDCGSVAEYATGETLMPAGSPVVFLWVCISGCFAIDVDRGAGPRRAYEWRAGDVSGLLPYSRMTTTPGTVYALEAATILRVGKEHFAELIRECPAFAALTVHLMLDRARTFNTNDLHDEKMMSLGRLAAGLAHELNNPASVTVSAARMLLREIVEADDSARALGTVGLSVEQIGEIERVREICLATPVGTSRSLPERVTREETILRWLEQNGADPDHAAPLADTPASIETLDLLARAVKGPALNACLNWIATGCTTRALAVDIERAAGRIHDLVSAVQRFSFMDRPAGPELVDLSDGLRDTVAIMGSKARSKSADIALHIEPEIPRVLAAGAELNQIWFNLIDNALDALSEFGRIDIRVGKELDHVLVRIADDGHGVPAELMPKIFDPFFTTKEPGKGTGLGLDIAQNLVRRHSGEIQVESRPGRTEFRVRLPSA